LKEKGAFEHKNVAMLGNTETIEQTFQRVLGQEKPKILLLWPARFNNRWRTDAGKLVGVLFTRWTPGTAASL
jgi:hypothetical protein